MTPRELLTVANEQGLSLLDLRFADMLGQWRHLTVPTEVVDEKALVGGFGIDGSSMPGWQGAEASDLKIVPDLATFRVDAFRQEPTGSLICDVVDPERPEGQAGYAHDPRAIARRALLHLERQGVADAAVCGPEPEFSVLDRVEGEVGSHGARFFLSSEEEAQAASSVPNVSAPSLAHKLATKSGYLAQSPLDRLADLRAEMARELRVAGLKVEALHHEVGSSGQSEIAIRYAPLMQAADQLMAFKYVIKNVAARHGKVATFMPKPVFADNGNGMHVHLSLWKAGEPLFAGDGYAGLSELALSFIAGILHHAPALCAFGNPTTNSYKRLVAGFEAPVHLCYGARNRSAAVRIPMVHASPKAKRIEIRFGDPTANPYLYFSALLMAGLDGIERKLQPGDAIERDVAALPQSERARLRKTPRDLHAALDALAADGAFLQQGDVFPPSFVEAYVAHKRAVDVAAVDAHPHPLEYQLYLSA
jgi:glutamine synthetase